jgi:hypothetical protein
VSCARAVAVRRHNFAKDLDQAAMRSSQADRLSSIPSTTGGIARLACAHLTEFGKDAGPIIAQVGASPEQVYDDSVRLEVPKQIRILDLVAEEPASRRYVNRRPSRVCNPLFLNCSARPSRAVYSR